MNRAVAQRWEAVSAPLAARWRALGARERQMVSVAGTVVLLVLAWVLAIGPAWRTLSTSSAQIDRMDAQLQHMRRLAAEVRELRDAPVIGNAQAVAALHAATERLGEGARLQVTGDRATLTVDGASGEALRRWLADARSGARARPVEAALTRAAQGYNGTLVVALTGAAP